MRGSIYSDQRCAVCGSSFRYDDRRRGLICPNHPDQQATKLFTVQFGRLVKQRFNNYIQAERFLDGLRYEVDKGTFDHRDYQAAQPLAFKTLSAQWLQVKKQEVKPSSFDNLQNYMARAVKSWGSRNIKTIGYAEIEDFLFTQKVSDKTRSNIRSCLHTFWTWLRKRRVITPGQFPEFPEIRFELGWRQTISKDTQLAILDEVKRISYHINPKIWIGIKWLSTYISIRPAELLNLKEKFIDINSGYFFIPHPKEKKPKVVPILDLDVDLVCSLPRGFPELYFFRHTSNISGCREGQRFGGKYLYKWWKKACANLGIEGIDLYGGTRHSSALALRDLISPEQIRRATMHGTNKAFERYFRIEGSELRTVYGLTQAENCGTAVVHKKGQ